MSFLMSEERQGMCELSYITSAERSEARRLIEETLGFRLPPLKGKELAVKLWVQEEDRIVGKDQKGQEVRLCVPQPVRCEERIHGCVGLVVERGEDVPEERVQVGDFVLMPQYEGTACTLWGIPFRLISSDKIYGILQDPTCVNV